MQSNHSCTRFATEEMKKDLFRECIVKTVSIFFLLVFCLNQKGFASDGSGSEKSYFSVLAGSTLVSESLLTENASASLTYATENAIDKKIVNVIALSVFEESPVYIPGDFSASVKVKIEYSASSAGTSPYSVDQTLTVNYSKAEGGKYKAKNYFTFSGAEYVKVTVLEIDAPSLGNVNTRQFLILQNEMQVTRYYSLKSGVQPISLSNVAFDPDVDNVDEVNVTWQWPDDAGQTLTQLEWTWVEDELLNDYKVNGAPDDNLLFTNNSTRVDLPRNRTTFAIPMLYGGIGKLYYRIRAVNIAKDGTRIEGLWSSRKEQAFKGHENSLNWQSTATYAEEGKRKVVVQYYDGSLRSRQTVTKENVTGTTVAAETLYDGQGRPAIQILPTPGVNSVIAYTKNLNLFKANSELNLPNQEANEDPAKFFDLQPVATTTSITPELMNNTGASQYYSTVNTQKDQGRNPYIPDAKGYPYTVTHYTPDATGRIMAQSGVGDQLKMGSGHETRYYYGTPSQEELDGLFGTEVGHYSHYFKNMVKDANGQMSVSYVDMHGRTIATALAGDVAPSSLKTLDVNETTYPKQTKRTINRNLLSGSTNVVKNNSIESITSLLVPTENTYQFSYALTPQTLQQLSSANTTLCYDCLYNLEISITDESGEKAPIIKRFNNISLSPDDDCNTETTSLTGETAAETELFVGKNSVSFPQPLMEGSYIVRKTLSISESSLQKYKEQYGVKAMKVTEEERLIDSISTVLLSVSQCDAPPVANTCAACLDALGDLTTYRTRFLASLGNPGSVSDEVNAEILSSYNDAKLHCDRLCNTTSPTLATKRSLMLADMIPFSGQYAKDQGSGTMFDKFNIFSTVNPSREAYYQNPLDNSGNPDYYRTQYNIVDQTIQPGNSKTQLKTTSKEDFAAQFNPSWAEALLPYHPEYQQLLFSESKLKGSYNWINTFNNTTTYADAEEKGYLFSSAANITDPFYAVASPAPNAAYKSSMAGWVTSDYQQGLSMWQIAYGNALCRNTANPFDRADCYKNASKTPAYSALTTAQKDQIWLNFRALYSMERETQVNNYIQDNKPSGDANTLVAQGYLLHFPTSNYQMAQQFGNAQIAQGGSSNWSWFPANPGDPPVSSGTTTPQQVYSSRCSSYINQWRQALLQCPALASKDDATREQIVNEITTGMVAVCEKGSDEANPFGSSTVAPTSPSDGTYRSFEQVVNTVLSKYNIAKDNLCNPFVIEFPKPYGNNPTFISDMIAVVDTCNCTRLAQLKADAAAAHYNPSDFTSFNNYLQATYEETMTLALYTEMTQNCAQTSTVCRDTVIVTGANCNDPVPCNCTLTQGDEGCYLTCTTRVCSPAASNFVLTSPQPMPAFLKCGFVASEKCVTCKQLSDLTAAFKSYFAAPYNTGPVFSGTDLSQTDLQNNVLFAQFLNFRTGYQYSWVDYAQKASLAGCDLATYASNTSTEAVICRDTKPLTDADGIFVTESPCQRVHNMAVYIGQQLYKQRTEALLANFEAAYRDKCLAAKDIEQFTVQYTNKEYHYTLYYYDQAGNLVKTVPPKGVRPDFSDMPFIEQKKKDGIAYQRQHVLVTNYRYNSLGQVVAQNSPDGGTSSFWYDRLGRLAVSQNAQQKLDNKYSYTLYDELGRIIEVGQKPQAAASMSQTVSQDKDALNAWINTNGGIKEQITLTGYDLPYKYDAALFPDGVLSPEYMTQKNLRNRVSYTATRNLATDADHFSATYYTYDVHGNVDVLLQDYKGVAAMEADAKGNRFKLMTYDYDLISGKVNAVSYQPGKPDAFYHRYEYDAENRLTEVKTSRDGILWERDAAYSYYKHGPLARTELGQLRVQGIDYVYTLQGWLKGINPGASIHTTENFACQPGTALDDLVVTNRSGNTPAQYVARNSITFESEFASSEGDGFETVLDPNLSGCIATGGNAGAGTPYDEPYPVARDAYGFSLHYYGGDYAPIGSGAFNFVDVLSPLGTNAAPLFNGNIAAMAVNISKQDKAKVYNYRYDQLNRLVSMDAYNGLTNTAFTPSSLNDYQDYRERITYDPNGNILTYFRNGTTTGGKSLQMDDLSYHYDANTNRLNHVTDPVPVTNYTEDIDGQDADNYQYDAIGNLKKDGTTDIYWNVYGKITSVVKNSGAITYSYDAAGNRISKSAGGKTTVYVRDASGNVMSVYEKEGDASIRQTEVHLYGSSRIGIVKEQSTAPVTVPLEAGYAVAKVSVYTRGEKSLELANHLGNVLATVSDKKIGMDANIDGTVDYCVADVVNTQDYYPFGMTMPGRTSGIIGRYGFNGKETDPETGTQDYGMRIYNPALGKFLSVDPLTKGYPMLSPYVFAMNDVVRCIDLDGLEKKVVIHWLDGYYGNGSPKIKNTTVDINKSITYVNVYTATGLPVGDGKKYAGTEVYYALPDGRFLHDKTMFEEINDVSPKPSANYDYTQKVIEGKEAEDNQYVTTQFLKYQDFLAYADIVKRDLNAPDNALTLEDLGGVEAALTVIGYANVKGSSGFWALENQNGRSSFTRNYQKQISGVADQDFWLNGVRFDGLASDGATLLEAKGKYAFLLEKGWAQEGLLKQAQRQIKAANGAPIEWHFAEAEAAKTVKQLFSDQGIESIKVFHTPSIGQTP